MGVKVAFPGMPAGTGHELREGWRSVLRTAFAGLPRGRIGWVGTRILSVMTRLPNAALAESLHLRPDDEVLDVGCGAGVLLADRAWAVCFVAGLDASAVQVGVARERLGSRISAGTAAVVQGDAAALPWEDGRPRRTPGCGVLGLLAHQEPGQGSEGCAGAAGPVNRP